MSKAMDVLDQHEARTLEWLAERCPPHVLEAVRFCLAERKSLHRHLTEGRDERVRRAEESAERARKDAALWRDVARSLATGDECARQLALSAFPELREGMKALTLWRPRYYALMARRGRGNTARAEVEP